MQKEHLYAVASKFYSAAFHYNNKVKDKPELKKALAWSEKAYALVPESEPYKILLDKLSKQLSTK